MQSFVFLVEIIWIINFLFDDLYHQTINKVQKWLGKKGYYPENPAQAAPFKKTPKDKKTMGLSDSKYVLLLRVKYNTLQENKISTTTKKRV